MTLPLLLALIAAQGAGLPPHPDIPAAATVAEHVGDCIAATTTGGVDPAVLEARGWTRGNVQTQGASNLRMAIFSRPNDLTVMSMLVGPRGIQCIVMSPVGDPAGLEAIRAALDGELAVQRGSEHEAEAVWITPQHRVTAVRIGNAETQGLKIVVTPVERQ